MNAADDQCIRASPHAMWVWALMGITQGAGLILFSLLTMAG